MFKLDLSPESLNEVSILVGIFLPLGIAYIVRADWNKRVKQYVAIALAVVAAVAVSMVREGIGYDTLDAFIHSVFTIVGVAQTFYLALWSTIGARITEKLEKTDAPGVTSLVNAIIGHA